MSAVKLDSKLENKYQQILCLSYVHNLVNKLANNIVKLEKRFY